MNALYTTRQYNANVSMKRLGVIGVLNGCMILYSMTFYSVHCGITDLTFGLTFGLNT